MPTLFLPHPPLPTRAPSRLRHTAAACTERPPSATPPPPAYQLGANEVAVRFTNTPSGRDVIAAATPGDGLLAVSDSVGVSIPRACQSGLCGTCTCDILDPSFPGGVQTVRACQTGVVAPTDGRELVVDVARMKVVKGRVRNPMARFDNLDTEYVAGAPPRLKGRNLVSVTCSTCEGDGNVECYGCEGSGVLEEDSSYVCPLCAGSTMVRCADCQGTGNRQVRS